MNILFVHQGFPGQYVHICKQLLKQPGNTIVSVGMRESSIPKTKGYHHYTYQPKRGNGNDTHPLVVDVETKAIRAEACAEICHRIKEEGFTPDIICGHPGWGELLFLPFIWPDAPILMYQEFCYNVNGFDCAFDKELQPDEKHWLNSGRIHFKNANTPSILITPPGMSAHRLSEKILPRTFSPSFFCYPRCISDKARLAKNVDQISFKINDEFTEADKIITS